MAGILPPAARCLHRTDTLFRYEVEQMPTHAGLAIQSIEGGHHKETYTAQSPRMFVQAERNR